MAGFYSAVDSTASGGDAEGDTFDGIEWVAGSEYDDVLTGDTGDNRLFGNEGHDVLAGGAGNDQLHGGTGYDHMNGNAGNDRLYGGEGDDKIYGAAGDDLLVGGAGDDILVGGGGIDVLVGDDGNDVFMLQYAGQDTVEDFTIGADTIGIWGNFADVTLSQDGDDTLVVSGSSSMRLSGVMAADLSEADFTLFRYGTGASETMDYSGSTSRINVDGNSWNDTIIGSAFDDTFRGGHGNDQMHGGLGDDKYIIDLDMWGGANWDTITDTDGTNTIRLDGSINADDITAVNTGNNLVLTFGSTGKKVTITDQWLDLDAPAVEFMELSNGKIIDMRTFHDNGGDDTLTGTSGADTLNGYIGNDEIDGGDGNDTIYGGEGNDRLIGAGGEDFLYGGDGDDYIADGAGQGTMDGGDGVDTVDVSHTNVANVIDLDAGTINWNNGAQIEIATNFENAVGSQGANTILGTDDSNVLDGQDGNDTLNGGLGRDTLMGGVGDDTYIYNLGDGSDVIIEGGFGAHLFENYDDDGGTGSSDGGSYDPDSPLATEQEAGSDKIVFGAGISQSDLTFSDIGDDLLIHLPDGATITIKGFVNQKVETLEFADGSTMDLTNRGDVTWTGKNKTWFSSGVDNYFGGEGDDTLNAISGHDTVQGGGGNDTMDGGSRDDHLYGGSGNDNIKGGTGIDTIYGDSGDDIISGDDGVDFMDGGTGNDTVDFSYYSAAGLTIDLEAELATWSPTVVETIANFENAIGSGGDDIIKGTNEANVIDGGAGNDVIEAGAGDDTLTGGTGANTYVFSRGDGMDTITDFNAGVDTLRIEGAAIANISIDYNGSGILITYGTDAHGNPVDQIFLDGVPASAFGLLDIDTSVANTVGGTSGADTYVGTDAHENITMNGGDDDITAGGGNDDIDAGAGADTVHAGTGNDKVTGGTGADLIYLDAGNDLFVDDAETGANGNDVVHGGEGNDLFLGEGGDDTFYGDEGNDTLYGGAGNDTLIGDAGTANGKLIATYYRLSNTVNSVQDIPVLTEADGVRIASDLDVNALAVELGGRGDYYGVRYVGVIDVSTAGNYTFKTGSDDGSQLWIDGALVVNNDGLHAMAYQSGVVSGLTVGQHRIEIRYFEKGGGNTLTTTVQGPDTGAVELDIFASGMLGDASASTDAPSGLGLEDVLNGGAGNDTLIGGSGADALDGGEGEDTASYIAAGSGVIADLSDASNNAGEATGDTYNSIESLIGSFYNDSLTGNTDDNTLVGFNGDDHLNGGAGSDFLIGGNGNDVLNCGAGDDIMTGGSGADIIELDFGSGSDVMTDFEDGVDIIDLSATGLVFGDLTITANGSGDAVISFDDGDGATALDELTLTGITAAELTSADFQFG